MDVFVLVQPSQPLKWRLNHLCRNVPDLVVFQHLDQPPVCIRVVSEVKSIVLRDARLTFDGCYEVMPGM